MTDNAQGERRLDQKTKWSLRADRYESLAIKLEIKAAALEDSMPSHARDPAFLTQPARSSRGVARERARLRDSKQKAWTLREQAKAYREKAQQLRVMAARSRGDAEAERKAKRESMSIAPGDLVRCIYGERRVLKVNAKSLRLEGALSPITIDKALCERVSG